MLNGNTIELGVCYYPEHWDTSFWKEDMLRMKSYGIGVIRVAEFAWNLFEPEEGRFDDSFWDRFLNVAKDCGMQVIFCTPTATPPAWLTEKYPEVLNCDIYGHPVYHGMRKHHNMTSPVYLDFVKKIVEHIAAHYSAHPAIIGWCPFNETWDYEGRKQDDDLLAIVYRMTKLYDTTRPCIDTSGNFHVITDIYDLHDYEQNPEEFASHYESYAKDGILAWDNHAPRQKQIVGIPVFISEYGGIKWDVEGVNKDSWGYGDGPRTEEEFLARYKGLTDVLLDNPKMFGFCYTQLYDVEQEMNGLYTYGRKPKFDMEIIRRINSRKAAIEEGEA